MNNLPTASLVSRFLLPVLLIALLSGCAAHRAGEQNPEQGTASADPAVSGTNGDDFALEAEFASSAAPPPLDPLGGYNRVMTQVNDRVYLWLLKPVAQGYAAVIPETPRLAVGRFFRNLLMPVRFTNNLLQLKPRRAGTELARFAINTTVGVLGFADPATHRYGLQAHPEDFGQTLGHYGVGSGFHIVLPLLGPSNLRDTVGLVPDHFLDPVNYLDGWENRLAVRVTDRVNHLSLHLGEYESLKKDAVDLYSFLRDGYEQRRKRQIEE